MKNSFIKNMAGVLITAILISTSFMLTSCTVTKITEVSFNFDFKDYDGGLDTYTFGRQDGKDIEWFIIYDADDFMTLLSKDVLDSMKYNDGGYVAWEKSSLHDYLNGQFIKTYFNKDEQERLMTTNDVDPEKVTMLSLTNITDIFGDTYEYYADFYTDEEFLANVDATAKPTDFLIRQGVLELTSNETLASYLSEVLEKDIQLDHRFDYLDGNTGYWLINQDDDSQSIYIMNSLGYVTTTEINDEIGIRPIIRIKKQL